jgi:hypothetical protein
MKKEKIESSQKSLAEVTAIPRFNAGKHSFYLSQSKDYSFDLQCSLILHFLLLIT